MLSQQESASLSLFHKQKLYVYLIALEKIFQHAPFWFPKELDYVNLFDWKACLVETSTKVKGNEIPAEQFSTVANFAQKALKLVLNEAKAVLLEKKGTSGVRKIFKTIKTISLNESQNEWASINKNVVQLISQLKTEKKTLLERYGFKQIRQAFFEGTLPENLAKLKAVYENALAYKNVIKEFDLQIHYREPIDIKANSLLHWSKLSDYDDFLFILETTKANKINELMDNILSQYEKIHTKRIKDIKNIEKKLKNRFQYGFELAFTIEMHENWWLFLNKTFPDSSHKTAELYQIIFHEKTKFFRDYPKVVSTYDVLDRFVRAIDNTTLENLKDKRCQLLEKIQIKENELLKRKSFISKLLTYPTVLIFNLPEWKLGQLSKEKLIKNNKKNYTAINFFAEFLPFITFCCLNMLFFGIADPSLQIATVLYLFLLSQLSGLFLHLGRFEQQDHVAELTLFKYEKPLQITTKFAAIVFFSNNSDVTISITSLAIYELLMPTIKKLLNWFCDELGWNDFSKSLLNLLLPNLVYLYIVQNNPLTARVEKENQGELLKKLGFNNRNRITCEELRQVRKNIALTSHPDKNNKDPSYDMSEVNQMVEKLQKFCIQ